ncbi:hypothetical protein C3941_23665 [Kaistia algarum]|uniref:three-Cys-motif partner protein TcmP n=1 Tax=Kaistia algarum TaxID=2083279 RepID=UPI000CE92234|nr:three-Cys-motif partner protein TcmP [Kaistia algarum]MCX5513443.1 three-Cys-motif partner protein TcmP [Kaistia algarum]PPE77458.1 hypothetical protein C3941_23665 [Kaistia algarum]
MRFGGPWTEIKLDAIQYYMECYTKALRRISFDLWYFDAFAGSGRRETERTVGGGLFDGPEQTIRETLDGSARRALTVQPGFDHFVFVEKDEDRCALLSSVQTDHPNRDIQIINGEANAVLRRIASRHPWSGGGRNKSRGVVFLDPFALQVDWQTLQMLASTKAFDVWYLFPIRDTIRQLAHDFDGVGVKAPMLDRLLSAEWRDLYDIAHEPDYGSGLFGTLDDNADPALKRVVSIKQFEQWLKKRLETEFPFVSEPLPLLTDPSHQAFSLFLAVANPSRPAIDLAEKFVRHVNKNFAPGASRRKSAL